MEMISTIKDSHGQYPSQPNLHAMISHMLGPTWCKTGTLSLQQPELLVTLRFLGPKKLINHYEGQLKVMTKSQAKLITISTQINSFTYF